MFHRIRTLVLKELQSLLRDRQSRMALIMPVIFQLALFPLSATLEVRNNTLAILNLDAGRESVELAHRFSRAQAFTQVLYLHDGEEMRRVLDLQSALAVVRFPADFSRRIEAGQPAAAQLILDGRRSNSGQIAAGYLQQILQDYNTDRLAARGLVAPTALVARNWFNPNLDFVRHIVPSLVAIITTLSVLIVTSLSMSREREQGTLDQLLVSPLTPGMIMVGKTIPAMLVALAQATAILLAGIFIYRIPFVGSYWLLYASLLCYILAMAGFGLMIATVCANQQQAFLGVFSFTVPAILLSGFPAPVENMPLWLQRLDWINPLRHFIPVVKGVFLKDMETGVLLASIWPLLVIAVVTLSAANWIFRHRLS